MIRLQIISFGGACLHTRDMMGGDQTEVHAYDSIWPAVG